MSMFEELFSVEEEPVEEIEDSGEEIEEECPSSWLRS